MLATIPLIIVENSRVANKMIIKLYKWSFEKMGGNLINCI